MNHVSVIIPTFNRGKTILRAVQSVLKQTYEDFDLWVIDDGSSDDTDKLLQEIDDARFNYLKIENSGVSKARNRGITKAEGPWFAFLDSDDEWLEERLELQFKLLESKPHLKFVHGDEIWIRNGVRVNQKKIHQKFGGHIFEKCLPLCLISPSASLIHQNIFNDVGLFDESYTVCEDYELWLRITSLYEIGFVDVPIIKKYGGHDDQLSRKFKGMDFWRVKALLNILSLRTFSEEVELQIVSEIIKKAKILKNGYLKHRNLENLPYIEEVLRRFC